MKNKISDNLKKELTDILTNCIGIETLEQTLKKLADSEKNEADEELWLQALAILQGKNRK